MSKRSLNCIIQRMIFTLHHHSTRLIVAFILIFLEYPTPNPSYSIEQLLKIFREKNSSNCVKSQVLGQALLSSSSTWSSFVFYFNFGREREVQIQKLKENLIEQILSLRIAFRNHKVDLEIYLDFINLQKKNLWSNFPCRFREKGQGRDFVHLDYCVLQGNLQPV